MFLDSLTFRSVGKLLDEFTKDQVFLKVVYVTERDGFPVFTNWLRVLFHTVLVIV